MPLPDDKRCAARPASWGGWRCSYRKAPNSEFCNVHRPKAEQPTLPRRPPTVRPVPLPGSALLALDGRSVTIDAPAKLAALPGADPKPGAT